MVPGACGYCDEPIAEGDLAPTLGMPLHYECNLRLIIGPVAHLEHRCSCFVPGSVEADPPHLTRRQAAHAAVKLYQLMQVRN